jgi:hypothetical protein
MSVDKARIAFGPEALSRFSQIIEEVSLNLIDDGLTAELVRSDEMRRKLAQRLLGFARLWWTDTQIKQLLLRMLHNQISASRQHQTAPRAENLEQERWLVGDAERLSWSRQVSSHLAKISSGSWTCGQD